MLKLSFAAVVLAVAVSAPACGNGHEAEIRKAFDGFRGKYVLSVEKRSFTLRVHDRRTDVVASYRVAYGLNQDRSTKLHAGDNRTPEGVYRIIEMLSMDAHPGSASYQKLSSMNRVYFRARDGHYKHGRPNVDLGDNAYGPRFFLLDYPLERDRARYEAAVVAGEVPRVRGEYAPIGHGIAIHGNSDEASIGHLSTSGCVRMYNRDILELEKYLVIGTPVIIYGE
ncbi:MAG TPA: L,D-transpeptidase [Spirochaetota bacterium]|nr:L,D-transpeptidase [Spirochaetota bacterium]